MAHPSSPSPSGSSRHRRLSEVLAEQQEPFSLDLYLLEKSCSSAFIDDDACGDGACSTCWSTTKSTGRLAVRNRKGSRRSGVLRMLLSKILSSTTAPAVTKTLQRRAAIEWRRVAEKQRTPDRLELTLRSASPRAIEEHMEDDGDESSKKQLSPVSVLEQRLFEHSSPPPHEPKALAIFGELLESAYIPNTLLDDVLAIAKDPSSVQSKDGRRSSSTDSSTSPRPRVRRKKKKHAHRKEDVAFEKDFARLTSHVASEMAGARVCAEDLRPTVEDVGAAIAAAMLEALTEETAAELI